ncbi:MAG TPA: hypothetical protein VJ869_14320 [Sphaerochaeta sp.]|nr:hypothetical protein [Sphaerochaeta sp.]
MKILTAQEQLRKARAENAQLLAKNQMLEEAVLELAQILSEAQHGETVPTEDK